MEFYETDSDGTGESFRKNSTYCESSLCRRKPEHLVYELRNTTRHHPFSDQAAVPATTCEIVRVQHCAGGPRYDPQYVAAAGVRPPASRARFVAASRRGSRRPRRGADRGTVRPAPGFRGRATDEGSEGRCVSLEIPGGNRRWVLSRQPATEEGGRPRNLAPCARFPRAGHRRRERPGETVHPGSRHGFVIFQTSAAALVAEITSACVRIRSVGLRPEALSELVCYSPMSIPSQCRRFLACVIRYCYYDGWKEVNTWPRHEAGPS